MRELTRSALVARPPQVLYQLVADVQDYPLFVPGCTASEVLERGPDHMVARLAVRRGALTAQFTTRNTLVPGRSVHMHLVEGPFRVLDGQWDFEPVDAQGCRIEFRLRFEFSNRLKAALFEPLFEQTAASLVTAFVNRAREVA